LNILIVVPTYNAAPYLERCLTSLLLIQPGSFDLHVHVQDGGSMDDTVAIASRWRQHGVTCVSDRDNGLYDAVNKAAEANLERADIMTWLGADDMMLPGTLATVSSIFSQLPDVRWVTGKHFVGNPAGESYSEPQMHLLHREVAEGLHDGRTREFIMQEGTFWRATLWRDVGGLDTTMRYAGDWDLWRRFAAVSPPYLLDFPLARFTQREGQTSSDMSAYYAEVDSAPKGPSQAPLLSYDLKRWTDEALWRVVHEVDQRPQPNGWSLREALRRLFRAGLGDKGPRAGSLSSTRVTGTQDRRPDAR
jgi:glycosyltransferase involved in cell wall biosynthesis